jgi:ribose transport system permease protein
VSEKTEHVAVGGLSRRRRVSIAQIVSVYGLLLILVGMIVVFSFLIPDTFPTLQNLRAILSDKANIALLALAVTIPLSANQFDLSVGFVLGLTHVLAIGFQVKQGLPWGLAVFLTILVGLVLGLANGFLVAVMNIDSFIATLGMGTIVLGLTYWYSGGLQVYGTLAGGFLQLAGARVFTLPVTAFIVLFVGVVLWLVFEYLPIGRYLYVLGANPRAAQLVGISRQKYILGAFMASGVLTAINGVLLASKLRVGQSNVGPDFLLPGFVGALLGATAIRPGRVNAWGTLIAVGVLAVGISGLEQLGAQYYVEPLFNGSLLVLAVALTQYAARRRVRAAGRIVGDGRISVTASWRPFRRLASLGRMARR